MRVGLHWTYIGIACILPYEYSRLGTQRNTGNIQDWLNTCEWYQI